MYYSNRSASYGGKGSWLLASNDAKECIRLNPSFIKGYYRLATSLIELKDYDIAIATIRQGLAVDNNNTQLMKQLRQVQQIVKANKNRAEKEKLSNNNGSNLASPPAMSPNNVLDSVTSKELQDLQLQYGQTSREYNTSKANLNKTLRECKLYEITKQELTDESSNITNDTNCYQSVGKIFLKSTRENILSQLDKNIQIEEKKGNDTKSKINYLERRLKLQQQNVQELLQNARNSK